MFPNEMSPVRDERRFENHFLPSLTGLVSICRRDPPINRWAIVFRADGAGADSFERGEDFGNVRAVARLKAALRGLGQFFADARRRFTFRLIFIVLPLAQTAGDIRALFERQRGNRSLDFSNRAHAGKLSARRIGVNAAKKAPVVLRGPLSASCDRTGQTPNCGRV